MERIGIDRARAAIDGAAIVLWLHDPSETVGETSTGESEDAFADTTDTGTRHIHLITKSDIKGITYEDGGNILHISAKTGENIDRLEHMLVDAVKTEHNPDAELIITNARHHAELLAGAEALRRARAAMDDGLSADFIAQDIREALTHLGLLTGAVTTDTLLQSIFTRFCIGK